MEWSDRIKGYLFIFFGMIIFIMSVGAFLIRLLLACAGLYFIAQGLHLHRVSTWRMTMRRWFNEH
jgi:uncharacterized protein HemY